MTDLRIGIVSPYSLTVPGGVQNQILGLGRALRAMGVDTRVLGPCDGAPPDAGVTPLGASLPTAANGSVAPIAPDAAAALRTMRALRDEEFDVLHLHEPMAPGPTMTAALLEVAPTVGTFHAAGRSSAYRYLRPLVVRLAARLDVRCAVSPEAAKLAASAIGGDFELVFNGVEVDRYAGAPTLETEGPTIFFCGRHEPRKGLSVLLEASRSLGPDLRVWVASDGPETEALRAASADDPRIVWLGRISDAEKIDRLRSADVFCAPSLGGESFGVVLLEAMAASTPVVASALAGYAAVARNGADAILVPPGDAGALATALGRALGDHDVRAGLIASGLERAQEFSMARLATRYLEIYERAHRNGHRPAGGSRRRLLRGGTPHRRRTRDASAPRSAANP